MDLNEELTLTDKTGNSVSLPFINLLRITVVKMQDLFLEYQQETGDSTLTGFNHWVKDKLGMTGKNVLM
jgi:hypothetical protein